MGVAIEGREVLGHRREALNRHAVPPSICDGAACAGYDGMLTGNDRMPWMKLE
jgi:hypothetical protein